MKTNYKLEINLIYQANFIMIYTVFAKLGYLNKEAEMIQIKGMSFLTGVEKPPPRSEKCFREMQGGCNCNLTLFYHNYFKEAP